MKRFYVFSLLLFFVFSFMNVAISQEDKSLTVTITGPEDVPTTWTADVTITFSHAVSDFDQADVLLFPDVVATITNWSESEDKTTYTATITTTRDGPVHIRLDEGVATNEHGNTNPSTRYTLIFDKEIPSVSLTIGTGIAGNSSYIAGENNFVLYVTFSELVAGFAPLGVTTESSRVRSGREDAEMTITGGYFMGATSYTRQRNIDALINTDWWFTVHASSDEVTISIEAGVAEDANGNPTPAATLTVSDIDYTPPELLEVRTPTGKQPAAFDITLVYSEELFGRRLGWAPLKDDEQPSSTTIDGTNVILTYAPPDDLETWPSSGSVRISFIHSDFIRDLANNPSGGYYYSSMPAHTPVQYFSLSDYDLDKDDDVDTADVKIAVQALGQSGDSITDERVDLDDDGDVDKDDVLLVLANLDEGAVAPLNIDLFTDIPEEFLEGLDLSMIALTLDALVIENDDSLKYQRAITFFQALLTRMRPEETLLLANYPNPFNPETWIPYELADASNVTIIIYNMQGIVVRRLDLGHQQAGYYTSRGSAAYWDGKNDVGERVASGVYFYTFTAGDFAATRKMLILK